MAKKKKPATTEELPGVEGPGVAPISIPEIDKAVTKYERKKEVRCSASPDEIAAKKELTALLHQHREKLPKNGDGLPFYRYDEKDYFLEEKLKCRKVGGEEDGED